MKEALVKIAPALMAYGPWGFFLLGVIDSSGVPLPAAIDFLLIGAGAAGVSAPGRAYFIAFMAIAGSVLGNIILFLAARKGAAWLRKEPASPGKRQKFGNWFRRYGLLTVFGPAALPIVPLPLKVFVISAGAMRTSLSRFVAVIVAGRVIRYFGLVYLGLALGEDGAKVFFARHGWTMGLIALAVTVTLFGVIRLMGRKAETPPVQLN